MKKGILLSGILIILSLGTHQAYAQNLPVIPVGCHCNSDGTAQICENYVTGNEITTPCPGGCKYDANGQNAYCANSTSSPQPPVSSKSDATLLPYTPLEPLPFVYNNNTEVNQIKDFPTIVNGLFKLVLAFGTAFAVLVIVIYGIEYATSEVAGKKAQAKGRVQAAILGLLLLLGAWLILHEINPQLLSINLSLPSINATAGSQAEKTTPCNDYAEETICADGDNKLIEAAITANQTCDDTQAKTDCSAAGTAENTAQTELYDDYNQCVLAYHGTWVTPNPNTQNCSQWDKKLDNGTTFKNCIAVPDPSSATKNLTWFVCGYN